MHIIIHVIYYIYKQHYRSNGASVNHAIVTMLRRITVDCELPGMLYRLAVFDMFNTILQDKYGDSLVYIR